MIANAMPYRKALLQTKSAPNLPALTLQLIKANPICPAMMIHRLRSDVRHAMRKEK